MRAGGGLTLGLWGESCGWTPSGNRCHHLEDDIVEVGDCGRFQRDQGLKNRSCRATNVIPLEPNVNTFYAQRGQGITELWSGFREHGN